LGRGYARFLLSIGAVVFEVPDLVTLVAGTAGGLISAAGVPVSWLGLSDVHLVNVPLLVLHLDRSSLGVSVPPVVVSIGVCAVRVNVHWDRGIV
jgi:hypothetical protein